MPETIPILWVSQKEEILHRGYADQSITEAILSRELWRPPGAFTFEHHEIRGDFPDDIEGAVVILPSRHHVGYEDWFVEQLSKLKWSVVILTSEEEWIFDWKKIPQNENSRLWVMQARPEHENVSVMLPCGWYPHTRELLKEASTPDKKRKIDWFFAGQITHERRQLCAQAMREMAKMPMSGHLHETAGYFQGMPAAEYFSLMAQSKVIPCPSGPESLCTGRAEEALEAGCVPILDLVKPKDPQFNYWKLLFGEDMPMPTISNWDDLYSVTQTQLKEWPANSNRIWSFWQQQKRKWALKLDSNIHAVRGTTPNLEMPDDQITVIMTTSPAPLHPSTEDIEQTVESVRAQLPDAEIIIVADGVRPEQEDQRAVYEEYLQRLFWLTNFKWHNVVPVRMEEWGHQANCMRKALTLVNTPLVLFVEHDTPIVGEIDWPALCEFTMSGQANEIRLHQDVAIHPDHESIMLGDVQEFKLASSSTPLRLRRSVVHWQRPHIARTDFYRDTVMPYFPETSKTMIEDRFHGVVWTDYKVRGEAAWWDTRIWVYHPEGENIQRSVHLNSRMNKVTGEFAPKFDMRFE